MSPPAKIRTYSRFDPSGKAKLPGAAQATVQLASGAANRSAAAGVSGAWAKAGDSPVALSAAASGSGPNQVHVVTAGQATARAAGVRGVLFSLSSGDAAGPVGVSVDASTFRQAYGGDYAYRLRLVRLPECALTTPELPRCQTRTPVRTSAGSPLTAEVSLTGAAAAKATGGVMVLAATSDAEGSEGDYGATSLSPGGSWSVSGNTGSFTYSYPIAIPPPIGSLAPSMALDYNSASQDARTSGTNNQSSWIGDGWGSTESYIERSYKSCGDVSGSGADKDSGDLCWAGQVLTMSLNGVSTAIVWDATAKTFRPAEDDASIKIENLFDATNGTRNGEYFRVTKFGVRYYFGLNRLPGWASGKEETKSVYTVPVYKAHAGAADCPESTTFADTSCVLGYRFNLDYAVDLDGNAMAYYYATETGHYGFNLKNDVVSYIRGGTLRRIDYGMTASTVYAGTAPEQIKFETAERCLPGLPAGNTCSDSQFSVSHPEYWPDTPIDLNCAAGATDCRNHQPTFWIRTRLTAITTHVTVDGVSKPLGRYDLTQTFPDGGDHAPTLWLDSIKHSGLDRLGGATADIAGLPITFYPIQIANRVGTIPGLPLMYHTRIKNVVSETGAETIVDYSTPTCSGLPKSDLSDDKDTAAQKFASTNTTGCFPVYWTPESQPRPMIDWFYTHPVTRVATIDNNNRYQDGTQPRLVTEYTYVGKPGWHYDDNELVKAKNRTWGQFRGYPVVETRTGDPSVFHYTDGKQVYDKKTLARSYYFLGMNGDTLPGGGTRSAPALNSQDGTVTVADNNVYAGMVFESEQYTAAGGTLDSATVTVPTQIGPTATRARSGLPALTAQMVRPAKTLTRTKTSYGWRKTESATFYNTALGQSTTGMPVQTADRGETGAAGNAPSCTFNRYIDGPVATVVLLAESIGTDQDCDGAGATVSGNLLTHVKIAYDTKGHATAMQQATASSGATATAFVTEKTLTYDSYGRVTSITGTPNSKAADGTTSIARTVYTRRSPAGGALPSTVTTVTTVNPGVDCSAVTVSSKDCQLVTETRNPGRQLPLAATDVAGAHSSMKYDALGRLTEVWLANQNRAAGAPPSIVYEYRPSATGPSVVTTKSLLDNGQYSVSKVLSDALLRTLESQGTGENGTVIGNDVQYDSHGWKVLTNDGYAAAGTPSDSLLSDHLSQVSIPASTVTDYDGMGRATQSTAQHNGVETAHTRTAYAGDKTTTVPPQGGVAITETVNARGQRTQLDQYTTWPTLTGDPTSGFTASGGVSQSIKYTYTPGGQQATVTGPDNAVWSYKYDLRGRQSSQSDPDTGSTFTAYDDAGNLVSTKDTRGIQLDYTYDLLGRKLTGTDRSKSNFKFASWTYDTLRIGLPTSSTRYVSGVTGGYTVAVTGYSTMGNPLGQKVTLPSVESPLPVEYETDFRYTDTEEKLAQQDDPAVGGLPGETITYSHNALGSPTKSSGIDLYVANTIYTDFGKPSKVTMGTSANPVEAIYAYDEETLRLSARTISRSKGLGPVVDHTTYRYDEAGNPLSVVNDQTESGNTVTDAQCYRYNTLKRLVEAWTASSSTCADTPSTGTVATGAGAYWQTFAYDVVGNRTQAVDHSVSGGADTTTKFTNGCTTGCNRTGAQPHTLTATSGGADPTSLVYDVAGNLLSRTASSGNNQTLSWNSEGRLAKVVSTGAAGGTTEYLYDADGKQLIRRDPGRTTLFAGDTQVVVNTAVSPAVVLGAVRTYTHGGGGYAVAMRSTLPGGDGAFYLFNDPLGTAGLTVDTTTQAVSRQQYKPYGETRGSPNPAAWPDTTRGYLGAPKNAVTGYTDLGARKYDPALGRFISPDPILELTDPNQLGGYTYAGDNPIASSDPSGLIPEEIANGLITREEYESITGRGLDGTKKPKRGSGGKGRPKPPGDDSDKYSLKHNAAQLQAAEWLTAWHPTWYITMEFRIERASKSKRDTGEDGYADIVGYDPEKDEWYIWEVKHTAGGDGAEGKVGATGAEAKGPTDLDWYISVFEWQHPGENMERGPALPTRLLQPNPDNPSNSTLLTDNSRHGGRVRGPEYDGVIVYWTHGRREDEPQMATWKSKTFKGRAAEGMQGYNIVIKLPAPAPSPSQAPEAPKAGFWEKQWKEFQEPKDPFSGSPWLIPFRVLGEVPVA
ncbi:RHS repeat-associated core domain-containing protein [Actinoplanes sp. NPDC026623]|uniref:RHS repeat domain-containing protein n=1 Tax=Actinoplanes sp. NPDC026623 TaxID=3155610 RepID=UPI0033F3660E